MTDLNTVLIGNFLKRIRRPVDIEKNKKYKLLTVKLHHKGVLLRCIKDGSEIGAKKMYAVKAGDFILSGIDARNGAFGIVPQEMDGAVVTNDFWYFNVDANVIDKSLFLELTQTSWFDEICRKGSDGTTQRIRLQKDKFYNQEIQLPPKKNHATLLKKILNTKTYGNNLVTEITHQQSLLKKLRQSILQDAISGKLTKKWREENPDVEPASELLAQINAEKERLVKENKIKKQKPLLPISEEEIPFELPDGWVWCRIEQILKNTKNSLKAGPFGSSLKKEFYVPKGYKIYGQEQVIKQNPYYGDYYIDKNKYKSLISCTVYPGDILISLVGTIGKVLILPNDIEPGIINPRLIKVSLHKEIIRKYFSLIFESSFLQKKIDFYSHGSTMNIINMRILKQLIFPLPQQEEQQAVVSKVEKLFASCNELEQQIGKSQLDSELLMQAVLKEAFEG